MRAAILFFIVALIATSYGASAAMYKWVDENGAVHYTDNPATIPENSKTKKLKMKTPKESQPKNSETEISLSEEVRKLRKALDKKNSAQNRQQGEQAKEEGTVVPYRDRNGIMLVDVKVNGSLEEFIFDTGATGTVITSGLAKKLDLPKLSGRKVILRTVAGKVRSYMVRIKSMEIGSMKLIKVTAAVRDFTSPESKTVGLLGQNVLKNFSISINRQESTITLVPVR